MRKKLPKDVISYLNPDQSLSQFQRSRSFIDGLEKASKAFRAAYRITARGTARPYWATSPEGLAKVGHLFLCYPFLSRIVPDL